MMWCSTFCADDVGVNYYVDDGYGDWVFENKACLLKQQDQTQKDSITWIGGSYSESLTWHNMFLQVTLSAHDRYSDADILATNDDDRDDALATDYKAHPSIYVRSYPDETGSYSLGGGYQVGLRVWENAISLWGDGCGDIMHTTYVSETALNMSSHTDYVLGVDVQGSALKVYIDGTQYANFTLSSDVCTTGSIGFHTRYSSAVFHNLTVANTSTQFDTYEHSIGADDAIVDDERR